MAAKSKISTEKIYSTEDFDRLFEEQKQNKIKWLELEERVTYVIEDTELVAKNGKHRIIVLSRDDLEFDQLSEEQKQNTLKWRPKRKTKRKRPTTNITISSDET